MIKIEEVTDRKKEYLTLLLLADPSEQMVDKYLNNGRMYVLFKNNEPVCEAVVVEISSKTCELKNLATADVYQKQGYATKMLHYLFELFKESYAEMYVGTSEFGGSFYQRFGFVYSHTIKNFFVDNYPKLFSENGLQCIDMLYLKRNL